MPDATTAVRSPMEVVRAYTEAVGRGEAASVAHLLHPEIRYRALITKTGSEMALGGRAALTAEWRDFFAPYGPPEVLSQSLRQVGPFIAWRTRWRLTKGGERDVFEWQAYLAVEDGQITRFDEICTGRLPEAG